MPLAASLIAGSLGHSSIKVTFDLYGHPMPGAEAEAASLLDAYLTGPTRGSQSGPDLRVDWGHWGAHWGAPAENRMNKREWGGCA